MSKELDEILKVLYLVIVDDSDANLNTPAINKANEEATQAIEHLIKKEKQKLLKKVEECVPDEKDLMESYPMNKGWNDCRTQIIKSIKELEEKL